MKLNKGSFATVWRGCNLFTQNIVAIKVVKRANLKLKDDVAVLNEVSVLQSLRHPHILPVYEFFEETDFFFIAMELLTGGDVFDCIVKKNQYTEGVGLPRFGMIYMLSNNVFELFMQYCMVFLSCCDIFLLNSAPES